jgi:hypothetical protein
VISLEKRLRPMRYLLSQKARLGVFRDLLSIFVLTYVVEHHHLLADGAVDTLKFEGKQGTFEFLLIVVRYVDLALLLEVADDFTVLNGYYVRMVRKGYLQCRPRRPAPQVFGLSRNLCP